MTKERKTADEKQILYEKALNTYKDGDVPRKTKLDITDLFNAHDKYQEELKKSEENDEEIEDRGH